MFKTLAYAHKVTFKLVFCYFLSMRKKKGNELPSLPPANLPYKEESEWLDRLFDSFLQEKINVHDLKKGVILVFLSLEKKLKKRVRKDLAHQERAYQPPVHKEAPLVSSTLEVLTPKAECPKCGKTTLAVEAPFEVWLRCSSCGFVDSIGYGSEGWERYVELVQSHQLKLVAGGGA